MHALSLRGSVGALLIRILFWGYCTMVIRNPQNSIGNYLGPYSPQHFLQYRCPGAGGAASSDMNANPRGSLILHPLYPKP